jgi:triosephosphate isomerase
MTTTRKKLIVGNWKMNLNSHEASTLLHRLHEHVQAHQNVEVVLAPSLMSLQPLSVELDRHKFRLAAQNAYHKDQGAYTGEVSFNMLRDLVHYAIIGHSERRIYFNESLETIRDKVAAAVRNKITPILCIGETKQVIHDQLTTAISNLTSRDIEDLVIAYEPVWAISTFGGELAKPGQIEEVIKYIRYQVKELYGQKASEQVRVIYGGSVDEHVVGGYLAVPGCDGALPGSASLNYHKFAAIVEIAHKQQYAE